MYAVRENIETSENIENMEKSAKMKKKLLRAGKGKGNSFSANLTCLNFEIFWGGGGSMTPNPPKAFWTCSKFLH